MTENNCKCDKEIICDECRHALFFDSEKHLSERDKKYMERINALENIKQRKNYAFFVLFCLGFLFGLIIF